MTTKKFDYQESSFREKLLEHVFLSELLQEVWLYRCPRTVEVLRAEVDYAGYDLLLEYGGECRYIQLKSSSVVKVNTKLIDKLGGCVILLIYKVIDGQVSLTYRFWEGSSKECLNLCDKTGEERPNKIKINIGCFDKPVGIVELFDKLFPASNPRINPPSKGK